MPGISRLAPGVGSMRGHLEQRPAAGLDTESAHCQSADWGHLRLQLVTGCPSRHVTTKREPHKSYPASAARPRADQRCARFVGVEVLSLTT